MININPFIDLVVNIIGLANWSLTILIILRLLININVINPYQPVINNVLMILNKIFEPILNKIRRYTPQLGGMDLSAIILFLLLGFVKNILYTYFYR